MYTNLTLIYCFLDAGIKMKEQEEIKRAKPTELEPMVSFIE